MFDLKIEFDGRSDGLAVMGEALGRPGISVEGGGMFTVGGRAAGHFLVEEGTAARRALIAAGLRVAAVREVLARRLDQEARGNWGDNPDDRSGGPPPRNPLIPIMITGSSC